jgi:HAD superfamily 5'-nucleotidase-like hydrolase
MNNIVPDKSYLSWFPDVEVIGFDLDHTLARYHLPAFMELLYKSITTMVVQQMEKSGAGISIRSLLDIPYDPSFGFKGLVYDTKLGNLIKVNIDESVICCFHGDTEWTLAQIHNEYDNDNEVHASPLFDERYVHFQAYYDTAILLLFRNWVIWVDQNTPAWTKPNYGAFMTFLYPILDILYDDWENSLLYTEIRNHPEIYLQPRPKLKTWLSSTKKIIKTFLLSNSISQYVDFVCEYLFGKEWKSYFDVVITHAQKPSFFDDIPDSLMALTDQKKVLFFEDSISSLIGIKNTTTEWNCGLVCEELESHLPCKYFGSISEDNHWYSCSKKASDMIMVCLEDMPELFSHVAEEEEETGKEATK